MNILNDLDLLCLEICSGKCKIRVVVLKNTAQNGRVQREGLCKVK